MNRLVLAFPGSGKTTLVKEMNKGLPPAQRVAVDLDWKGPRPTSPKVSKIIGNLAQAYLDEGKEVFSFANYFNPDAISDRATVVVGIPLRDQKEAWTKRIADRGDVEFAEEMSRNWDEWLTEWEAYASKLASRNPATHVMRLNADEYLSEALQKLEGSPVSEELQKGTSLGARDELSTQVNDVGGDKVNGDVSESARV